MQWATTRGVVFVASMDGMSPFPYFASVCKGPKLIRTRQIGRENGLSETEDNIDRVAGRCGSIRSFRWPDGERHCNSQGIGWIASAECSDGRSGRMIGDR